MQIDAAGQQDGDGQEGEEEVAEAMRAGMTTQMWLEGLPSASMTPP